jgi:hypothetical protein
METVVKKQFDDYRGTLSLKLSGVSVFYVTKGNKIDIYMQNYMVMLEIRIAESSIISKVYYAVLNVVLLFSDL